MRLTVLLLGTLLAGSLSAADLAKTYPASRPLGDLAGHPGWETAVLATDQAFSQPPFPLVLRPKGGAPLLVFGRVEGSADAPVLRLDSEGDGTLDASPGENAVPGWLALRLPGPRGDGRAFRALASRLYAQYNREAGPAPAELNLMVEELRARAQDASNRDNDLDAALVFYVDQGLQDPALAEGTLAALDKALESRGGPLPLSALFRGEALAAVGRPKEALKQFDRLLKADPRSLIGAAKKASLDPAALAAFRKAHPDFWATRS